MKNWLTLVFLIVSSSCKVNQIDLNDSDYDKYRLALRTIEESEFLKETFTHCNSKANPLSVFPKFTFLSTTYFSNKVDLTGDLSRDEMKSKLRKIDRPYERERVFEDYPKMPYELMELTINKTKNNCLIIGFDRIRQNYLSSEVTYFKEAEEWEDVVFNQVSYLILFDFNQTPLKFHTVQVER